jgi:hypothetical protein
MLVVNSAHPAVNFGILAGNSALGGAGDINSVPFDEGRASPIPHVLVNAMVIFSTSESVAGVALATRSSHLTE